MTLQQIELHPCSDSVRYEADRRIPYASLAFLELQAKYNSSLPTDALQLVMAYDLAKQSFSGNNLEAWTGSVLKQWNKLCSVKKYHDDEYLAVLQLLLTLQTKNGVWNEWAANYCTHFSDPKNFKCHEAQSSKETRLPSCRKKATVEALGEGVLGFFRQDKS
jgi:hypothetical protein